MFYESLGSGLNTSTTYYDLCDVLMDDAASLGFSSAEIGKLMTACQTVEIYQTLMGSWPLDEGSGTTAGDSTAYNRDCTFAGDPNWVAGVSGQGSDHALDFDGNDDAHRNALPALCGGAATISAWVKPTSISDQYDPIVTQYHDGSGDHGYYLCLNYGKPTFYLNAATAQDDNEVPTGYWCHIAGTYDGNDLKIYVNGAEGNSVSVPGEHGVSHSFYIGASGTTNYFNGLIDDVRVYNYACGPEGIEGQVAWVNGAKVFWVRSSSGSAMACFDDLGNLFVKGTLTEDPNLQASASDEFCVQKLEGQNVVIVAIINMATGDMVIAGTQQQGVPNPSNFIVKNSLGNAVAYIDASGNLRLAGNVYPNWDF